MALSALSVRRYLMRTRCSTAVQLRLQQLKAESGRAITATRVIAVTNVAADRAGGGDNDDNTRCKKITSK